MALCGSSLGRKTWLRPSLWSEPFRGLPSRGGLCLQKGVGWDGPGGAREGWVGELKRAWGGIRKAREGSI
eukprot:4780855-Alexandrium_andersonii.AAC.1